MSFNWSQETLDHEQAYRVYERKEEENHQKEFRT